jgi:hypothetical protein
VAFQAALKTLGWTEAGPCGLPRLSLLRLLSSRERNALLCQALTGAARAALLVGRSLEYACAFAGHALSAAQLCDSGAQRALLPVAERTMLDVLLAQSAAHARDGRWRYARSSATSSSRHAANEEALALVRAALETARSGEFNEVIAKAEEAFQQRSWSAAIRHAEAALALASGALEHERAQQLCNGGRQGAFDEVLGTAHTHLQHQRFARAETVAADVMRAAFDPPSTTLARAVLACARLGLHEAALNEAAVAAATRDWDRVIAVSNRARSHAATEAQRAAADARLTQAHNAMFSSALDAAQAHLSAGRWEHAEASANSALHYAHRSMDVNAARAVLFSVSAQRDAAEGAESEYINAVDDFIRRRPDFSGDAPKQYTCRMSLIVENCPKPAAIPHDVATILRRHADVFTVAPDGATVRLVRLTPWRGDQGHRVFGEFRCTKCNKRWRSAATYCDKQQACQNCKVWMYPYAQRPLERKDLSDDDEDNERRPHDMVNCQKCRELGRCCVPMSPEAIMAQRNGEGGMYRGGGRRGGGGGCKTPPLIPLCFCPHYRYALLWHSLRAAHALYDCTDLWNLFLNP